MAENSNNDGNRVEEIQDQIQQTLKEIEQIRKSQMILTSASDLELAERKILQATDKLASLLTGLKIQQAIDSDEIKEQEKQLIEALPEKLKNQGRRRVEIQTSRGAPVTVEVPYFSRKKKKSKSIKRKKKK